ncbi:MAG: class I mannose-6-phosphate isomerase [Turicibacter sp.]
MSYLDRASNFDKYPEILVSENNEGAFLGYKEICDEIGSQLIKEKTIVALDCYVGVYEDELLQNIQHYLNFDHVILTKDIFLEGEKMTELLSDELTDDRVFGHMTNLKLEDLVDHQKLDFVKFEMESIRKGTILILGLGATFICKPDLHIYADLARWEIQRRYRNKTLDNYKAENYEEDILKKYKRGYFVEWRLADLYKTPFFETVDYLLDSNDMSSVKMISGDNFRKAMNLAVTTPFRVVPFFDPGVWGGQWMKEVCGLDQTKENYAWCFDCVPEENSLFLRFGTVRIEIPSIDVVLYKPQKLLGSDIFNTFGAEFPIRFDFLDTMEGGNLSLQVHPLKAYIKEKFGMDYTQDESYYMLDTGDDACVYLGLKDNVDKDEFVEALDVAQRGEKELEVEKFINRFEAKKHDHFLIPSGTIHCSGKNSMVLEISATPYIFTFKLWDWGRLGLDKLPRPVHLEHGKEVIQFDRTTDWVKNNLVNQIVTINEETGCREERTGLHNLEFIETRRHWFNKKIAHHTNGTVNVLNLIEGESAIVASPTNAFKPMVIHYAETFIVPAHVGEYTISPYGNSIGKTIATLKAYVRKENI